MQVCISHIALSGWQYQKDFYFHLKVDAAIEAQHMFHRNRHASGAYHAHVALFDKSAPKKTYSTSAAACPLLAA